MIVRRFTSLSRKYVYVIMLILYNDSHTYLVLTNYTDTCISHLGLIIYKIGKAPMNQKFINQDTNETEINKMNTVFNKTKFNNPALRENGGGEL